MNNSKANRRLRSLWYKKDIVAWIDLKYKLKRYPEDTTANDSLFKMDMSVWNSRFTHEEIQLLQYKDWQPYCCNELAPCASRAWDRMEKKSYGWYCPFCGLKLGKHLYRIYPELVDKELGTWNNYRGLPYYKKFKGGIPMEMRPTTLNTGPNTIPSMIDNIPLPHYRAGDYITVPKPVMMVNIKG